MSSPVSKGDFRSRNFSSSDLMARFAERGIRRSSSTTPQTNTTPKRSGETEKSVPTPTTSPLYVIEGFCVEDCLGTTNIQRLAGRGRKLGAVSNIHDGIELMKDWLEVGRRHDGYLEPLARFIIVSRESIGKGYPICELYSVAHVLEHEKTVYNQKHLTTAIKRTMKEGVPHPSPSSST